MLKTQPICDNPRRCLTTLTKSFLMLLCNFLYCNRFLSPLVPSVDRIRSVWLYILDSLPSAFLPIARKFVLGTSPFRVEQPYLVKPLLPQGLHSLHGFHGPLLDLCQCGNLSYWGAAYTQKWSVVDAFHNPPHSPSQTSNGFIQTPKEIKA